MNKKIFFLALIFLAVFGFSNFALAQSTSGSGFSCGSGRGGARPGVFGTVTAVNGDTITVQSRGFGQNSTQTTYTVDASNATVTKNNAASSVSDVAVGDSIMVQGTVSGTNVTATSIRDGMAGGVGNNRNGGGIFGTVASINGTSLTVMGRTATSGSNAPTYTVDASNATVTKNGASSSVSDIVVGDTVMIQGTVSGTSVTATAIRDGLPQAGSGQQKPPAQNSGNAQNNSNPSGSNPSPKSDNSLWGNIVGFFKNLFGFK